MMIDRKLARNTFILFIQNQEYVFCCLKFTRVQLYKLLSESYFTIPLYSFTMHSSRGTLSVGWADRFSLWVVFYVYDEWFMGKLWGPIDFLHTTVILNT